MSKVRRLFVEKREGYDVYANRLFSDFRDNLGISGLTGVRALNRYDVEGLSDEQYKAVRETVFADLTVDHIYDEEMRAAEGERVFSVEFLSGQYNQRAASVSQGIQLFTAGERPLTATARTIVLKGGISDEDFQKIKAYYINPIESKEAAPDKPLSLEMRFPTPDDVLVFDGFIALSREEAQGFGKKLGLAMTIEDLLHCQKYFRDTEKRDPTITEIRMLDTYWSDHCRHTTFLTRVKNIEIEDAPVNTPVKAALKMYEEAREYVYGDNHDRKKSLMDIAQMGMRVLRKKGLLDDLDVSEEINACSIVVPAVIDGKTEEWLVMFKNETHNHPTEMEPFGGAGTCLGGGIRDPLSGRSYVYQAMRLTGAGDPRIAVADTLSGKLPQRKITTAAALGYSSYGNQIGVASGHICEIYHEGFVAKRMECGALVAAAPKSNVVRCEPKAGDLVLLVGGRTGRDGCGGATGSSKEHTEEVMQICSAEVQKGDPALERNILRLFRDPQVSRVIRRCNDFGAGGVSVAIGELAAGLDINLDAVPAKYEGLDGTELAISESQERMAVVIDPADLKFFEERAHAENLETAIVAKVTDTRRLKMTWRGKTIVDLSRDFIDTNGIPQETEVFVKAPVQSKEESPFVSLEISKKAREADVAGAFIETMADLSVCSQRGIVEMFDSSVGASTVLMPFGGKYQGTPAELMVAKLPVLNGDTTTGTAMSYGFDPHLASWSPFHGALYAVIQSVAKVVASGGDHRKIRLSFQEYFEKLGNDKTRWGKPFAALLGAYTAQSKLGIAAIGGKDSMSGTFKDIHVPPSLISFAVVPVDVSKVISPEFKKAGSTVVFVSLPRDEFEIPDFDLLNKSYTAVHEAIVKGQILSVHTVGRGGVGEAVAKMCFGNRIGFTFDDSIDRSLIFEPNFGGLVIELDGSDVSVLGIGENCKPLGLTSEEKSIVCRAKAVDLEFLYSKWENVLTPVFPVDVHVDTDINTDADTCGSAERRPVKKANQKCAKPRVFIPLLPGTTSEYDITRAFTKAGAECEMFVLKNTRSGDVAESVSIISEKIANAQILMIPGGVGVGDEPDGSGKFIAAFFRNPRIKEAVTEFLNKRDGLILGIGGGFQALVKLGLLPYGEFRDSNENSPALTVNPAGRHISRIAYTKICSVNSPWLSNVKLGDIHALPISSSEGRFIASKTELETLCKAGQIATQYVNSNGQPEEGINGNISGSLCAVEGILSPDGRIFGKMGHSERVGEPYVAKNICGDKNQKIFEAAVGYFG
ncbi:MAG: phosphoribosylformylglycinamidine synthase [Chitinispirillales bacterium]|jgi:phosphoribosylformylglycinamidine synthase|nr:phosphoribosylformylglycinamidine synthase [Chitinispirillales bacterium]